MLFRGRLFNPWLLSNPRIKNNQSWLQSNSSRSNPGIITFQGSTGCQCFLLNRCTIWDSLPPRFLRSRTQRDFASHDLPWMESGSSSLKKSQGHLTAARFMAWDQHSFHLAKLDSPIPPGVKPDSSLAYPMDSHIPKVFKISVSRELSLFPNCPFNSNVCSKVCPSQLMFAPDEFQWYIPKHQVGCAALSVER